MPTRNTEVLERIVKILGISAPQEALARLEQGFESSLLGLLDVAVGLN